MFNIATFLLFRILTLGWMTRWLTVNRDHIPLPFFTIGSIGLAVIVSITKRNHYLLLHLNFLSVTTFYLLKFSVVERL